MKTVTILGLTLSTFSILAIALSLSGCLDKSVELSKQQQQVITKADDLFVGYKQGDIDVARRSLKGRLRLYEESSVLDPSSRLQMIARDYARLHLLEKRVGNEAAAEAALIGVRYWYLRFYEYQGISASEAIGLIQKQIPGEMEAQVNTMDEKITKGNGLRYVRDLQNQKDNMEGGQVREKVPHLSPNEYQQKPNQQKTNAGAKNQKLVGP